MGGCSMAEHGEKEPVPDPRGDMGRGAVNPVVAPRPDVVAGETVRRKTGCGTMYITINVDEETGQPFEIFILAGKTGDCQRAQLEALALSISRGLRAGISIDETINDLCGIRCPQGISKVQGKGSWAFSCADGVGQALKEWRQKHEARERDGRDLDSEGPPFRRVEVGAGGADRSGDRPPTVPVENTSPPVVEDDGRDEERPPGGQGGEEGTGEAGEEEVGEEEEKCKFIAQAQP